jgi:hypothetical protein
MWGTERPDERFSAGMKERFLMRISAAIGAGMMALAAMPAVAQISTPYNSYPPTPAERAETAELNREAGQMQQNYSYSTSSSRDLNEEQYRNHMQEYRQQMRDYQLAERQYWDHLRAFQYGEYGWDYRHSTPASLERIRERQADAGIVGQQMQIMTGAYVGKIVGVDRDASKRIQGLYVRLNDSKVVWIDIADVKYDSPYGIIYTDLDAIALYHMPDESF